jgi:peptidyl-tRNA hydrolase
MKMYILVRKEATKGFAVNAIGHAALACYLKFQDEVDMRLWLRDSFKKVTCKVTDEELEQAMADMSEHMDYVEITESACDGELMAVAFRPRGKGFPEVFKTFKLYR